MKKILIFCFIAEFVLTLLLAGCAKADVPDTIVETTAIETVETNVAETSAAAASGSEIEVTPETTLETDVVSEIVFSSSSDSQSTIYTCKPDGSSLDSLLKGGIDTSPSWNREHTKIVFTSIDPANGVSNLYIFDIKSNSKTLLLKRFSPRDPSFGPDGNIIVFADFAVDGFENSEIYTIGIDGNNLIKLTDNTAKDYFPKFSPDGKSIVFSSERDGNIQLYSMDNTGGNVKRLMVNEFVDNSADFSPDGQYIIFDSNRRGNSDIYKINADGTGEALNITNNSAGNYEPCYSPDGSMIAYRSNKDLKDSASYDIFTMSDDGSNQVNITQELKNTNEFGPSW
jgi:Tol biopolymer transport system component